MSLAAPLYLLLQAASLPAPPPQPTPARPPEDIDSFDLALLPNRPSDMQGNVIVVRADPDRYRLGGLDLRFETSDKAEIDLGNGTRAAAEVEAEEIAPGVVSKRMMLRLKTAF